MDQHDDLMIDPRKRAQARKEAGYDETPTVGEGRSQRIDRECRVPAAVVGWERYKSSVKGTPGLLVRFVALTGEVAGKIVERTFWLTPAAIDMLADFMLALGHTEPANPYNDDHLQAAFSKGAVMIDVRGDTYTARNGDHAGEERTKYEAAFFGRFTGKPEGSWNDLVAQAEKGWEGYCKWRAENPRPEPGSRPAQGGGSYGGGGGGGGGSYGGGGYGSDDEDIPF